MHAAFPQRSHNLDGVLQHFLADLEWGPAGAEDVFVEVFARSNTKEKTTRHQRCRRCSSVRDDGWVNAHRRTRNTGAQSHAFRCARERS